MPACLETMILSTLRTETAAAVLFVVKRWGKIKHKEMMGGEISLHSVFIPCTNLFCPRACRAGLLTPTSKPSPWQRMVPKGWPALLTMFRRSLHRYPHRHPVSLLRVPCITH